MGNDIITCFNGSECIYANCPQFNNQLDTCNFSIIGLLPTDTPSKPEKPKPTEQKEETNVAKFEAGKYIDVQGTLLDHPEMKKGTRRDGTEWTLCHFRISVDGLTARVSLWDELAKAGMDYSQGQVIKLKGIHVDNPYEGTTQLTSKRYTEILE